MHATPPNPCGVRGSSFGRLYSLSSNDQYTLEQCPPRLCHSRYVWRVMRTSLSYHTENTMHMRTPYNKQRETLDHDRVPCSLSPVSSARAQRGEAWPQGPPSPPSRRLRRHCRDTSIRTNSSGCGGGDRPAHQSCSLENQLVARSRAISSQPTTLQREVRSVRVGMGAGGSMATVGMEARSVEKR